jgi:hypothetical protein
LQRKRPGTLAPEWLALPMATVRKRLRTKNKSIIESIIYKKYGGKSTYKCTKKMERVRSERSIEKKNESKMMKRDRDR